MPKLAALLTLLLPVSAAALPMGVTKRSAHNWRDNMDASLNETSGNSQTRALSAGNLLEIAAGSWVGELHLAVLQNKTAAQITSERYDASEKVRYHWLDGNYVFEKLAWRRDWAAQLARRVDASAGLGRQLYRSKTDEVILDAGGGQIFQRFYGPGQTDTRGATYTLYGRWHHDFLKGASFQQEAEYIHNVTDGRDAHLKFVTTVSAPVSRRLSLRFNYEFDRAGLVPAGTQRVDRTLGAGISVALGNLDFAADPDLDADTGEITPAGN
ncbi:MAG: DUF481 domain-containing protein [Elusimicrobia bacterium]|nr:DUF481 domain-containing protein [Elusimicrobiota bacterium]